VARRLSIPPTKGVFGFLRIRYEIAPSQGQAALLFIWNANFRMCHGLQPDDEPTTRGRLSYLRLDHYPRSYRFKVVEGNRIIWVAFTMSFKSRKWSPNDDTGKFWKRRWLSFIAMRESATCRISTNKERARAASKCSEYSRTQG